MRLSPFALLDRLLAPAPDAARVAFMRGRRFAHRGLHGPDVRENSRAAFRAAVERGVGIECDVRISADGTAFVFHDETLDRLTGRAGRVADLPAAQLAAIRLSGSSETIPGLYELLPLVGGRVPLLIEIKAGGRHVGPICAAVRDTLNGADARQTAVMSFNPEVSCWFARHAPQIVRGLVVTEKGRRGSHSAAARHLALWRARPDFLAYDVRDLPSPFASAQRARGLPVLSWTVRGAAAEQVACAHADAPIFEECA